MSKGNNNLLVYGGVAVVGIYLLSKSSTSAAVVPGASTVPGQTLTPGQTYPYVILANHPAVPATWNYPYYLQYIYPAMLQANPNVGNPGYQLSQAELSQYAANYSDLRGWLNTGIIPHPFADTNAALQSHWTHNGVAEKRTFMPFLPTTTAGYITPPANANTSGSSSSSSGWLTALEVAGEVVIAVAGPVNTGPLLNDYEADILICGGCIAKNILPFYYKDSLAMASEDKLDALLTQYTR